MTSQQLADCLLAQWQELWRLSPPERLRRIDEIAESFLDEQLRLVSIEMEKAA
jgi:hypothetical protein